MKTYIRIMLALTILSFLIAAVLLPMMPAQVPIHFGSNGEADRIGSRFELLLLPFGVAATTLLFWMRSRRNSQANERVVGVIGVSMAAFFSVTSALMLWEATTYDGSSTDSPGLSRLVMVGLGVLLVVLGNLMPKAQRNAFYGLRTKWSLSSDEAWRRSQRFAGIGAMILGAATILLVLFLPSSLQMLPVVLLVLWAVVSAVASYRYARMK